MSDENTSDSDADLEKTMQENMSEDFAVAFQNMKLQMEELSRSLENERNERIRLSNLIAQQQQPAAPVTEDSIVHRISSSVTTAPTYTTTTTSLFANGIASTSESQRNHLPPTGQFHQQNFLSSSSPLYGFHNIGSPQLQNIPNSSALSLPQIGMRKIIDLPSFRGKPEEWPAFSVAFKESTENIGYSDWENHIRLTKALSGEAKDSVASLLIHPKNVGEVMKELERQFGQNEQLLRSQQEEVRRIAAIPENRLDLLIPFATKVRNLAAFLESMNSLPHFANPNLIDDLVKKLPPSKMVDWGMFAVNIKPYVTVRDFSDWVTKLAHVVSVVNISTPTLNSSSRKPSKPKGIHHVSSVPPVKKEAKCPLCQGVHRLGDCQQFKAMSLNERWSTVKSKRLCFGCLRFGHATKTCRSKSHCNVSGCTRYHSPFLHDPNSSALANQMSSEPNHIMLNRSPENSVVTSEPEVLFKILPVVLYGSSGSKMDTFAMIDEGSSITLVDESVLDALDIKGKEEKLQLQWFGGKVTTEKSRITDLEISGSLQNSPRYSLKNVRAVKNIDLPVQTMLKSNLCNKYHTVKKLPVNQYSNAKPLLLIGLDNVSITAPISSTCNSSCSNGPIAVKTRIGWYVYGSYDATKPRDNFLLHTRSSSTPDDDRFEDIIQNFFKSESFGVKISTLEPESETRASELLKTTTLKIGDKYQTGLLWKKPDVQLPPSFEMAKGRLLSMERKMAADPDFKTRYIEMVNAFIIKGYARKLSPSEAAVTTPKTWYLPHFATCHPNKPGKHRLVFDAAAKSNGVSLNDNLLKGPDLYCSLVSVLFNFRSKEVAVCADIKEMFSQVRIQPSDVHAQRFLWREDKSMPIEVYVMEAMTFGVSCSPASAHHVKNYNAMTFSQSHPEAAHSIIHHHYVDDFVDSFNNIDEAKTISSQVKMIHSKAGFHLRGFISNKPEVAEFLNGANATNHQVKPMNLEESTTEKILGLTWDTGDDCFKFNLKFNKVKPEVADGSRKPTKRELLSIIMSVFDPFGFLSNIMIHPKVLMQELWRKQIVWDEPVPEDIHLKWIQWRTELEKVRLFKLPRYYFSNVGKVVDIQIHTFVDASQDAFAAATYIRIEHGSKVTVRLISAKTRCAPIKQLMSIPRLELQAAVMGARICSTVCNNHSFDVSRRFFWSDSAIAINWIKSDLRRYKPFVAHRISEILENSKPTEWRWISTKLNVADNATRAKYPIDYDPEGCWVSGPSFLSSEEHQWPNKIPNAPTIDDELKPKQVNLTTKSCPIVDVSRFSNYLRMKRTVAWVQRFINNKLKLPAAEKGELTASELQQAEVVLCKIAQKEFFSKEMFELSTKRKISKSSRIYKLSPMISPDGLLRLNGRIGKSDIVPSCTKRPIIMPKEHPITKLIVRFHHEIMLHHNKNAIIAEIQRKFWIPSLKSLVNIVKSECQTCKNRTAEPNPPMMGELPYDRVTAFVRPFTYSGVDYFGPYEVTIGRRREKRYIALFTCLTMRAVHLELSADLSTDAFLLCVRNFVNRRGVPVRIRSDNGTNFVGATKEMNEVISGLDHDRIRSELALKNIEWVFNCPDNPHAGGSWERLVQAVKRVLSYTLHSEAPRVESLRSLLIEAENIVNSRPLTDVPITHEDEEALTPNHFLIGCANSNQTPGPINDKTWTMKKQWRISQLKNRFWKKWVDEYLPSIIRRSKWNDKVKPIVVGDLVLIMDSILPRAKWIKGRVIEVFAGSDGQVRSARVKTASGELKRPAVKLAVLNVCESSELTQDKDTQGDSRGGM